MNYAIILALSLGMVCTGVLGYLLGRNHSQLVAKIRELENRPVAEPKPEPTKPAIAGGAYQPPKEISNSADKKPGAGIVETKTPQQLEWENKNELAALEHSS